MVSVGGLETAAPWWQIGFATRSELSDCGGGGEFVRPQICASRIQEKLSLIKRAIPSSGEKLPVIGLGTWRVFDVGTSQPERAPLEEVLRVFVERGARVIDSSPMYGRAER